MTFSSFPFDGQDTDETQFSRLFREATGTGVANDDDLKVVGLGTGMVVRLMPGVATVRGHAFVNDTNATLPVDAAAGAARTDIVALRLDPGANSITPVVIKGTPGAGDPALTQTDTGIWEEPLARLMIANNTISLTAETVTDLRRHNGLKVGAWPSDATRPAAPRAGSIGLNSGRGYWEGWTGAAWVPVAGPVKRTWYSRRSTSNASSNFYGGNTVFADMAATPTIKDLPAGVLKLTIQHSAGGRNGRAGQGFVHITAGPVTGREFSVEGDQRMDLFGVTIIQNYTTFYSHEGGDLVVRYAHRCAVPAVVQNGSTQLIVEWVGPLGSV